MTDQLPDEMDDTELAALLDELDATDSVEG